MFIRKRVTINKRGREHFSYQVIETYRECGKVKQRVICNLGDLSTVEEALEWGKMKLARWKKVGPLKKMGRHGWVKKWEEKEQKRLKDLEELRARVAQLENVVSRMSLRIPLSDTTGKDEEIIS